MPLQLTLKPILQLAMRSMLLLFIISPLSAISADIHALTAKVDKRAEIVWKKWVADREQRMSSSNGWLSLAGLYWLNEGDNTLGSASHNQHIFPATAPPSIGNIRVNGDKISFRITANNILVDNQKIDEAKLSVKNATQVTFGSFSFFIIQREKGYAIRLKDSKNPALNDFKGLDFYAYNPALLLSAKLIKSSEPKKLLIQTVYGTFRHEDSAGWVVFKVDGTSYRLQAVDSGPDTPLFIMFTDATSEKQTYGAGRYIDIPRADKNGHTVIDFNYAYNPPCAFTHFATCPLPPRSNRLKLAIKAGEKYSGNH